MTLSQAVKVNTNATQHDSQQTASALFRDGTISPTIPQDRETSTRHPAFDGTCTSWQNIEANIELFILLYQLYYSAHAAIVIGEISAVPAGWKLIAAASLLLLNSPHPHKMRVVCFRQNTSKASIDGYGRHVAYFGAKRYVFAQLISDGLEIEAT